jgi:glycosyltransferase involved in cell wall biosynthesis
MTTKEPKIVVVLPAYNAARTLERTYADIPKDKVFQIILVDDVSHDQTVEIARSLGLSVVIHVQNRGYGGNQKTCYLEALKEQADVVVMLHPDHQYDSRLVPELVSPILENQADMVMGSRILNGQALQGGMPLWKYVANRALTTLENTIYGTRLTDCHSGFRAYSRRLLTTIPFLINSDDFVFDSQMIAQAVCFGFSIREIAVQARYFPEASSVNFRVSLKYGIKTLWVMICVLSQRLGLFRPRIFNLTLPQVVSRHYHKAIFRNPASPDQAAGSVSSEIGQRLR